MIKSSTGNSDKPAWNRKFLFSSATSSAYHRSAHFSNIMDKFHHREINNRVIQRIKSKTSKGIEKSVFHVRNPFLDNRTVKEIFKKFFSSFITLLLYLHIPPKHLVSAWLRQVVLEEAPSQIRNAVLGILSLGCAEAQVFYRSCVTDWQHLPLSFLLVCTFPPWFLNSVACFTQI